MAAGSNPELNACSLLKSYAGVRKKPVTFVGSTDNKLPEGLLNAGDSALELVTEAAFSYSARRQDSEQ